jgi:hypothetical protein
MMPCFLGNSWKYKLSSLMLILNIIACAPDITCPTGQKDAKQLFSGAETGRGTEKKRTDNGIIIKKNPKPKSKKH